MEDATAIVAEEDETTIVVEEDATIIVEAVVAEVMVVEEATMNNIPPHYPNPMSK